jgi:hypothetical protein
MAPLLERGTGGVVVHMTSQLGAARVQSAFMCVLYVWVGGWVGVRERDRDDESALVCTVMIGSVCVRERHIREGMGVDASVT